MNNYRIIDFPVNDKNNLNKFIDFTYKNEIYNGDKDYIPLLRVELSQRFSPSINPFFKHGQMHLFMVEYKGKIVGRASAHIDFQYVDYHQSKTGYFGFFECVNDVEASKLLLGHVCRWIKEKGMTEVIGPVNPTMSEEIGVLAEGFSAPVILTGYNPPYYPEILTNSGFNIVKTWYAWQVEIKAFTEKDGWLKNVTNNLEKRFQVKVRSVNMKKFDEELGVVKYLFNECWKKNWGFTPITDDDVKYVGSKLKSIIDPDLVLFAYINGQPVGVSVTLPNINEIISDLNGSLSPWNMAKLLYRLKFRKMKSIRVFMLGVLEEYRNRGLSALLYTKTALEVIKKGYTWGEASMTLEDNWEISNVIKNAGGVPYKKFYIFGKKL